MSNLPAIYQQLGDDSEAMSAGLTGSFGVISIRSGRFRVKYQGGEHALTDDNGNPLAALDVVIVRSSPALSKTFYQGGYADGSDDSPTCSSADGVHPDAHIQAPVAAECARCPNNVFGSRITPNGSKVKACADVRRLAVVPAIDITNEAYGGPMLLRVPAASLGNLADFSRSIRTRGLNSRAIVTRISFDLNASYPKLIFKPARMLEEAEVPLVLEQVRNPLVDTLITSGQDAALPPPAPVAQIAPQPQPVLMEREIAAVVAKREQVEAARPAPAKDEFFVAAPAAAPAPKPAVAAAQKAAKAAKPAAKSKPAAQEAFFADEAPAPQQRKAAAPVVAPAEESEGEAALENDIKALLATLD